LTTYESITAGLPDAKPRIRLRAFRFPAVPMTLLAQLGGGGAALTGVYLQWGIAVLLMVGGAAAVVLGMLREADKI
jgi:hypothetical protein